MTEQDIVELLAINQRNSEYIRKLEEEIEQLKRSMK